MGGRYRLEKVFRLIEAEGPIRPVEIADRLRLRRMQTYRALQALLDAGCVQRSEGTKWWVTYTVIPGAYPPDDGRGQHPNSRRNLGIKADNDWWRPCALAELLPFPLARNGD